MFSSKSTIFLLMNVPASSYAVAVKQGIYTLIQKQNAALIQK